MGDKPHRLTLVKYSDESGNSSPRQRLGWRAPPERTRAVRSVQELTRARCVVIRFHKAALLGLSVVATPVAAQQLVYTPVNPAFGGNPFNSTQMLALANAQNQFLPKQQSIQAPTQDGRRWIFQRGGRQFSATRSAGLHPARATRALARVLPIRYLYRP